MRSRLHVPLGGHAQIDVDSQADMLTWSVTTASNSNLIAHRLDDSTPAASTIVTTYESGRLVGERVFGQEASAPSIPGMIAAGFRHILTGLDHVLFVIGLALLGGGWKNVLKVLTAFTAAHALTLACTAMGVVHANPRLVEPLIAASIVALAVEGLRERRTPDQTNLKYQIAIAFGFGLVHGLGFAGGLVELGASGGPLIRNLVTFSAGIELGQLLVLALPLTVIALAARHRPSALPRFSFAASVGLGMIGSFWLAERLTQALG